MSAASTTVRVSLQDRSYDIDIAPGLLARAGQAILARAAASHAVVISDRNVASIGQQIGDSLRREGRRVTHLEVAPGEGSKTIEVATRLWGEMLAAKADRKSLLIAVGGGVIGDLAGFVAATFTRGLRFVQVPTTLLAQVDSSVGGKVAVNLPMAKNMVGCFWQPKYVLIDPNVLASLPEREYLSGLAEVVKYGVILDADFFEYLEKHVAEIRARDPAALVAIVARSCRLKADVVENDEREETGLRAVLNYGHTFAHAFEAVAGYGELLHGEAVSIGMHCAAHLAVALGRMPPGFVDRQQALLAALGLPWRVPADLDEGQLLAAMQHDKKVEHGRLRFVLPAKLGFVELVEGVESAQVASALRLGG